MSQSAANRTSLPEVSRTIYLPLVLLAAALTLGVLLDWAFDLPMLTWGVGFFLTLLAWAILWRKRHDSWACGVLLGAVAIFGGVLHHVHWNFYRTSELSLTLSTEKQPVALRGVVTDYPRFVPAQPPRTAFEFQQSDQWKLPLRLEQIRNRDQWIEVSGETEVYVTGATCDFEPGQPVAVFAQATMAEPPLNPGEFDLARWSRGKRSRIFLRSNFVECIQPIGTAPSFSILSPLQLARRYVADQLVASISPQYEGLAETIFLGRRERLDDNTDDAFRQTGTVHLLALSGLHLGILAMAVYGVLRYLPGPAWLPGAGLLLLTIAYVLLVDARPPILRASGLVAMICLGEMLFRKSQFGNSLAMAWIGIVALNPSEIFQVGTQLSFLAVAVLAWLASCQSQWKVYDPLKTLIAQTRPWPVKWWHTIRRIVVDAFLVSLVVWLVTLPLVVYHFHAISPWTVVLSPLLMLPMTLALVGLLLLVGVSIVVPPATDWMGALVDMPLAVIQTIVETTQANAPLTIWSAGPAWWWLIGFYGLVIFSGWSILARQIPLRWGVGVVGVWIAVGFGVALFQANQSVARDDLVCTFVSVGHGTCVLVELPGGQNLLYDCGRLGSPKRAAQSLSAVLWSKGISHLDAIVISHDDVDHFNGLPLILQRFSVGAVFCSDLMDKIPSDLVKTLLDEIDARGIPRKTLSAGQRLATHPDLDVTVLHPTRKGVLGRDNANSLVLLLEYQKKRVLLPGDLESPGTEAVILERPIACDVVMAPHHGSRHSKPEAFYQWCQPRCIVVSSGDRHLEGLADPMESVRWLNTAGAGMIEVRLAGNGGPIVVTPWQEASFILVK
ncbi:ComEC/Rec2 family competence protein [Bremerella cremea]|uniref:ComEC/Rec2 family competence protein n=1 Tax=Bremerella cremea TaxID=1031537 RepID=UPI0031E526B1